MWQRQLFDLTVWLPGVPIFFTISGFLIAKSYERTADTPGTYFRNRALRIFPALWVCLAVTLGILRAFGFLPLAYVASSSFVAWLAGQLSFVQFFNPEQFRGFGIGVANGALWTITVELQFYLFIPLLYLTLFRKRMGEWLGKGLFGLLFAISFVVYSMMDVKLNGQGGFSSAPLLWKMLFNTLLPHLWMFMLGILIHRYFTVMREWLEGKILWYLGFYLALATVMHLWVPSGSGLFYAMLLPARILLAVATVSAAYSWRSLAGKLLRGSDVSYGTYIYHSLVLNVFIQLGWVTSLAAVPEVLGGTMLLALLSWYLVEKPALACKSSNSWRRLGAIFPKRIA